MDARAHLSRDPDDTCCAWAAVKGSTGPNIDVSKPTMSLVQYSDSDSGSEQDVAVAAQTPKPVLKRKRSKADNDDLPPLPAAFHDLYSTNARVSTSDDPSLHGGRKRAVPHVDGNWPSHVYLECKDDPAPFLDSDVSAG